MTEPTKEELQARIAELEKQVSTRKRARFPFTVSVVSPSPSTMSSGFACSMHPTDCAPSSRKTSTGSSSKARTEPAAPEATR